MFVLKQAIREAVSIALKEDIGSGDITTQGIATAKDTISGYIAAQADGVVAGIPLVEEVFRQLNKKIEIVPKKKDGARVRRQDVILRIQGSASSILTGERTALNFLGMLSGIATTTRIYVDALQGSKTKVLDTRKTTPGLRQLVKYAVTVGGGNNHRMGLYDAVLIKDNHIALARGSVTEAILRTKQRIGKKVPIEVEAETLAQVEEAVAAGADIILLDNLSGKTLRQAVAMVKGRALTEVSGGLNLSAAKSAASLGVDRISVGALTHSAPWLPVHMELA
jgi:nicotinate-nucleotide pyrophosphorylase (carboxylating)